MWNNLPVPEFMEFKNCLNSANSLISTNSGSDLIVGVTLLRRVRPSIHTAQGIKRGPVSIAVLNAVLCCNSCPIQTGSGQRPWLRRG